MFRKSVALIMIVVCTLVCFPVSSLAAESDLQSDFDNGLITLQTSFTYYRTGVGYSAVKNLDVNQNNVSVDTSYTYNLINMSSLNPNLRFGHRFHLTYANNRVFIPQGSTLTFSIRKLVSAIYLGPVDEFGADLNKFYYLDLGKLTGYFLYFYDADGKAHTVDTSMYEIFFVSDQAAITIRFKSDIYELDVYQLRLFLNFGIDAFYNVGDGSYLSEAVLSQYSSFSGMFGYAPLDFEIRTDDEVVKGLLSSIIDSIKKLPLLIKSAFSSLFENLTSSVSGFFDSLKNKLTDLFSVFTEEQTTYAPIDEGELPSDYQAAEDEAFDAAGVGDLDSNIDSAFKDANSVFSNNNAYAFISGSMEQIVFGNVKISGLVIFSLAMGLCVLVLGRKLNSA